VPQHLPLASTYALAAHEAAKYVRNMMMKECSFRLSGAVLSGKLGQGLGLFVSVVSTPPPLLPPPRHVSIVCCVTVRLRVRCALAGAPLPVGGGRSVGPFARVREGGALAVRAWARRGERGGGGRHRSRRHRRRCRRRPWCREGWGVGGQHCATWRVRVRVPAHRRGAWRMA
jgi:hypothetical protein